MFHEIQHVTRLGFFLGKVIVFFNLSHLPRTRLRVATAPVLVVKHCPFICSATFTCSFKAFPSQMRLVIPLGCSGSALSTPERSELVTTGEGWKVNWSFGFQLSSLFTTTDATMIHPLFSHFLLTCEQDSWQLLSSDLEG